MQFSGVMNDQIRIRVSEEEKRFLADVARKTGQTLSGMIRDAVTEAAKRAAA